MKMLISHSANWREEAGETRQKNVLGPFVACTLLRFASIHLRETSLTPNRFSGVPEMQQEGRKRSLSPPFEIVSQ